MNNTTHNSHVACHLLMVALSLATIAAFGTPLMWGVGDNEGEGVSLIGRVEWVESKPVFCCEVKNYGTGDADSIISLSIGAQNAQKLRIQTFLVDGNEITTNRNDSLYYEYGPDETTAVLPSFYVGYRNNPYGPDSFMLAIILQPGCDPGRLRLSAMAGNLGGDPIPFNDLIIGSPYARPSLALARQAPTGPGTNAVSLAISSDAEFLLLQYTDTLAPTNWTDLARIAVTGAVTVVTDTNAAQSRFYRALVP